MCWNLRMGGFGCRIIGKWTYYDSYANWRAFVFSNAWKVLNLRKVARTNTEKESRAKIWKYHLFAQFLFTFSVINVIQKRCSDNKHFDNESQSFLSHGQSTTCSVILCFRGSQSPAVLWVIMIDCIQTVFVCSFSEILTDWRSLQTLADNTCLYSRLHLERTGLTKTFIYIEPICSFDLMSTLGMHRHVKLTNLGYNEPFFNPLSDSL